VDVAPLASGVVGKCVFLIRFDAPPFLQRRRDRISEKMRALQELVPHCDKVSKQPLACHATMFLSISNPFFSNSAVYSADCSG
jgi:hypothetical protein